MNPQTGPTAQKRMIRKLLFSILALAPVMLGFEAHRRIAGEGAGNAGRPGSRAFPIEPIPRGPAISVGGAELGISHGLYLSSDQGGTVRTLWADEFAPVSSRRATLRNVVSRSVASGGAVTWMFADRADLAGRRFDTPTPEFEEGRLTGNVEIRLDRAADTDVGPSVAGRPLLRETDRLVGKEADDLVIRCNDMLFRENGQRIEIVGRLSMTSAEMFLAGWDLQLEWTDIGQDVRFARLERGEKLVAYQGLLASWPPTERPRGAGRADSKTPADSAQSGAVKPGGTKLAAPKTPDLRAYRFTFHSDIVADIPAERLAITASGRAARLVLDLESAGLFSTNRPEARATDARPDGARPSSTGRTSKAAPAGRNPPATVTWTGPLEVDAPPVSRPPPAPSSPASAAGAPPRTAPMQLLTAGNGDQVVIRHNSSVIECTRFRVDRSRRSGEFHSDGGPVRLTNADGSYVEGRSLTLDPVDSDGRQRAVVAGPGGFRARIDEASDLRTGAAPLREPMTQSAVRTAPRPANPFTPSRGVPLTGRFGERLIADFATGTSLRAVRRADVAESAVFLRGLPLLRASGRQVPTRIQLFGDAELATAAWSARAAAGRVEFTDPAEWVSLSRPVPARVDLDGDVRIRRGEEILTAARVEIPAETGADGRAVFTELIATDGVRVRRSERELSARQRLTVQLVKRAGPVGKPAAGRDGRSASHLTAEGDVRLRDYRAGSEAVADRLYSDDDDSAVLIGSPERPVRVLRRRDDGVVELVSPDRILFRRKGDAMEAEIPGPGALTAPVGASAASGPAPAKAAKPADGSPGVMRMTWSRSAEYREDPATAAGKAQAVGDVDIVIDRIDADGTARREHVVAGKATALSKLRPRPTVPEPIPETLGAGPKAKAPVGRVAQERPGADTPPLGGGDGNRFSVLVLEHDVHVVGTERAAGGDRRSFVLAAPGVVRYDLERQRLSIPGRGELADEQIAAGRGALDEWVAPALEFARERQGFARTLAGFTWGESLEWDRGGGRLDLAGDVRLVNKSPDGLTGRSIRLPIGGGPAEPKAAGGGLAVLDCRRLTVFLAQTPPESARPAMLDGGGPAGRGLGRIRGFDAVGDVRYREGNQSVKAERAKLERKTTRDGEVEIITLRGAPGRPVESIEADAEKQIYRPLRGDVLIGVRGKSGDFHFRAENASGEPGR